MKEYYFTYQADGKIISFSENKNKEFLQSIKLEISDEQLEMIKKGYELCLNNKKIEFIKTKKIENEEIKDALRQKIANKSVTIEDVSKLLLKFL